MLRATVSAAEPIVSPQLLPIEITNIIRLRMRREGLTLPEAQARLAAFLALPVTLEAPPWLHRRALDLASEQGLSATYHSHYLALAEGLGCQMWTGDQRLVRALAGRLPFVRSIAQYNLV